MRCRWWFVGAGILLAVAVGFQQAEPLDKLHEFGKVGSGGWWVDGKLHGRRFVAKDSSPIHFVNALALLQKCPSVNRVAVPKSPELGRVLARLADIDHIVAIELFDKDVTDEDLSGLAGMKQLGFLDLSRNPKVTDAGIAALAGLENRADMASLYQLNLTGCPVTDESLAPIPRFPKLEELLLAGTEVTDTGLMGLVGWHSLRRVLWSDRMTVEGQHAFNAAFLTARRKAREAGVPMDPRDIPPIFFNGPR
jgi:hypothetical protein